MSDTARLAVGYDETSPALLDIVTAASGFAELVWLVDLSRFPIAKRRALARFGTIVDTKSASAADLAERLTQLGVQGIVAFNDSQLRQVAELVGLLRLPGHDLATATRLTDKYLQREALRAAGLPMPEFHDVPRGIGVEALRSLCASVDFPLVLKPRQGTASRETRYVTGPEELRELLDPTGEHALARDESFIVEGYLAGPSGFDQADVGFADYVSVESLSQAGVFTAVAVTGKFPLAPPFRETGNLVPSQLDGGSTEQVIDVARRATAALGLAEGAAHTEIVLTADGPRVLEVNGRAGGGGVPDLVAQAWGASLVAAAMKIALGQRPPAFVRDTRRAIAYNYLHPAPQTARAVLDAEGLAEVRSWPGVEDVFMRHAPGEPIDWREGTGSYSYCVRGVAASYAEVQAIPKRVARVINIRYDEGPTAPAS